MPAGVPDDDGARILPVAIRRPAAVLAVVCAVAFLALAVRYHGDSRAGRFDGWVAGWLGSEARVLSTVSVLAPPLFTALAAVATVTELALRNWRYAALTALGPGLTLLVTELGKVLVDRRIDGSLALPSGHTAGVTSVCLALAIVLIDRARGHVVLGATGGLVVATALGAAMALVMVAGHSHYATDTVAGYCVAVATTLGVAFAIDGVAGRSARGRAGAPASLRS
jgi:undecaprenyl-diphosphatase